MNMSFYHILREAEGDPPKTKAGTATDYTSGEAPDADADTTADDSTVTDTDATDDTTNTDDTEDANDYTSDDETDTDIDPDGPDDGTDEDTTDGANDYTSDGDTPDVTADADSTTEDTPPDETDVDKERSRILLNDFVRMYYSIQDIITTLNDASRDNIVINKIISQVTYNVTRLSDIIYDYIVFSFSKNKYVQNMYKYNYFIEALKINVEMLKKIQVFDTK
jgi:hypothetical protein